MAAIISRATASAVRCALALAVFSSLAGAQTDWYNTDRGRPLRIEDAVAIERHAFELQLTPFSTERSGDRTRWEFEPEIAWGFAPRTQVKLGVPITGEREGGRSHSTGVAGVHLAVLHALNTETLGVPAIAVTGAAVIPAGARRAPRVESDVGVLMTRKTAIVRMHANVRARVTGTGRREGDSAQRLHGSTPLWAAGLAIDRALALRSMLIAAELTAEGPESGADLVWRSAAGVRLQIAPRLVFDAGVERTFRAPSRGWRVTVGSAVTFAIPFLQARSGR